MKQKDILFIVILSTIMTIFWIGFNIHHNIVTSTISDTLNIQIQPITGSFDTDTVKRIKSREAISPNYSMGVSVKKESTQNQQVSSNSASLNGQQIVSPTVTPQQLPSTTPTATTTVTTTPTGVSQ